MAATEKIRGYIGCFALLATSAYAANVTGVVKNADGTPFRAAFVQAQNTQTRITVSVLSDGRGAIESPIFPRATISSR